MSAARGSSMSGCSRDATKAMISLASRKILVVEDEALIRLDMQGILTELGATVLEAESVRRARTIVLETTVDAAILDIIMPDGDTYPLAREFMILSAVGNREWAVGCGRNATRP